MLTTVVKTNPFTKEYYENELEAFKIPETLDGRITVRHVKLEGVLEGYMYKAFLVDYPEAPIFLIDGKTWMSITPMEVESHYMPIQFANGRVGVGGLGLGYYIQRILEKNVVEEVVVYELDKDVIDLYLKNFGPHPKLTIHHMSALDVKGEEFDFFYNDIYPIGADEKAFEHMAMLKYNNCIDHYHFWTMECFLLALANERYIEVIPSWWRMQYFPFLQHLLATKPTGMIRVDLDGDEVMEQIEKVGGFDALT